MIRLLAARLASSLVVFVAITLFVFVAFFVLPKSTPRREVPSAYRVHGSLAGAYGRYVWQIVRHGDLGRSYATREAVSARLLRAAPVTLSLVVGGVLVWLLIAVPLGVLAALRPRSGIDRASTIVVLAGLSVHPLWLGLVLGYLLGHDLHVLPLAGYCSMATLSTGCDGLAQWARHLVLPWITFGVVNAALFTAMTRALVREELTADYVLTARATGAGPARVARKHVLRNVLLPLLTMTGVSIGTAIGGVLFIETAFSLPGLGAMLRQSTLQRDIPMIAGSVLLLTLAVMVLNAVVDVAYVVLDPRLRHSRAA